MHFLFHVKQFLPEILRKPVGDGSPVPLAVRPDHRRKYCIFALRATDSCPYDDTNEKYVGIDDLGNPFAAGE